MVTIAPPVSTHRPHRSATQVKFAELCNDLRARGAAVTFADIIFTVSYFTGRQHEMDVRRRRRRVRSSASVARSALGGRFQFGVIANCNPIWRTTHGRARAVAGVRGPRACSAFRESDLAFRKTLGAGRVTRLVQGLPSVDIDLTVSCAPTNCGRIWNQIEAHHKLMAGKD